MTIGKRIVVALPIDLVERLKKRQHPRQSLAGVIEEFLNTVEAIEKLPDVAKPEQKQ